VFKKKLPKIKYLHLPLCPAVPLGFLSRGSPKYASGVLYETQCIESYDGNWHLVHNYKRIRIKVTHDHVLALCDKFASECSNIEVIGWLVPELHYDSYRTLWCKRTALAVEGTYSPWKIGFQQDFGEDVWPSSNLDAVFA